MSLFYRIIDSATLNAFVIFAENVLNIGERKKENRQKFLKELALALIIRHARQRLEVQQTTQDVRGHLKLRHFIGTFTSSEQYPASFNTAQEMLHLSQIKGQEHQIHL